MKIGLFSVSKTITSWFIDNTDMMYVLKEMKKIGIPVKKWDWILLPIEWIKPSQKSTDINTFFQDPDINITWAITWWFWSNEILDYIDYNSYKRSDKLICGFSDVSVLLNAIYSKTWRLALHSPNLKTLSKKYPNQIDSINDFILKIDLFWRKDFSFSFTNHKSYFDPTANETIEDWWMKFLHEWNASGIVVWWNLSWVNLLIWTNYEINFDGKILFLEECDEFSIWIIRRNLFQIASQKSAKWLRWIVFWRVNKACYKDYDLTLERALLDAFGSLNIPIIMNAPFWHVSVNEWFFIGSRCDIVSNNDVPDIMFSNI